MYTFPTQFKRVLVSWQIWKIQYLFPHTTKSLPVYQVISSPVYSRRNYCGYLITFKFQLRCLSLDVQTVAPFTALLTMTHNARDGKFTPWRNPAQTNIRTSTSKWKNGVVCRLTCILPHHSVQLCKTGPIKLLVKRKIDRDMGTEQFSKCILYKL